MKSQSFIEHIKSASKQILPKEAVVWLFGSRARGDNREDSDWDILILLDHEGHATDKDYDEIGYPLNELFWQQGQDVNTILSTETVSPEPAVSTLIIPI